MFRGPSFIVSTMQEETTPIFKRLWHDWTQQQPGIEPTNSLGLCWVPPIVAFYDQQGLLRTYSLPGGSIRSPHPGSPLSDMTDDSKTFVEEEIPMSFLTSQWKLVAHHTVAGTPTYQNWWRSFPYFIGWPMWYGKDFEIFCEGNGQFVFLWDYLNVRPTRQRALSRLHKVMLFVVVLRHRGVDRIYEVRCLFVAVGPNARFIVLPHWDNMS